MSRRSMNTVFEESNDGVLNTTGSSGNLLDRDGSSVKQNKRYRIFCELLETEQNYVDVLQCIVTDYRDKFDALEEQDRDLIMNKHERQILFFKIEQLLDLHKVILSHFENENSAWTGKNMVSYVFGQQKNLLLKYYVPYMNNYDDMIDTLNKIQHNPYAQQFLKGCEGHSNKKFTIKDLLIRPVQRLPSVTLLLKELLKHTSKSNPDHPCIKMALEAIDGVLSKSNDNRRDTDAHQQMLDIANSIDQFPPELIQSNRSFEAQADFQLLHSNGRAFKKYKGRVLTLFLFNDVVIVAKRRNVIKETYYPKQSRLSINQSLNSSAADLTRTLSRSGSMTTLKRSMSFILNMPKMQRKPFKHQETLFFSSFRQFMYIRQEGIFYLKLRDEMSDEMTTLRLAGETGIKEAEELIDKLCDFVNEAKKRELKLYEISTSLESGVYNPAIFEDEIEYIKKARRLQPSLRWIN